ncbi:MBL fold metallo-hydrolase [Saccharopolyspora phatthalungensis]|uniref:Glyoxylase-like metal-dependent hydrolase (Beta-lactamase superfamily II) n=1 Tax=Saccharopolyspora phatthalungensis TaxID=664693 RepID=A0A840QA74_9PSEU|nr:MBL fold metallo-hydrolase [Saccharopolyspora phatthalungensis]MBB5157316.1 glyoxylase-like metal-dependent hydrolase (beta-lactamase superfamily II) [Saccharopolyspora phatthalungensis]
MSVIPPSNPLRESQPHVAPSATDVLPPGTKIDELFERNMTEPYVLQRLSPRVWWVSVTNYTTVFLVGEESVLLFDAPLKRYDGVVSAVSAVTDKPISTIVYSHFHTDHLDDIDRYVQAAQDEGRTLRLVASEQTDAKLAAARSILPRPTQTVSWPNGSFDFEGSRVELHGFEWAAHTEDHAAWLLPSERVVHVPDLISPDQPPFWRFAANERFLFTRDNLDAVDKLEWDHLSGGHGNVGDHGDLAAEQEFIAELLAVCENEVSRNPLEAYVDPELGSHTAWFAKFLETTSAQAADKLREKYGHMYGFESSIRANAEAVTLHLVQYH